MKYNAIIETDDFEDFEFFEDGCGKYIRGIDAGSVNGEWIALYFTECKQESVLDKIRAEIQHLSRADSKYDKVWVSDVMAIIDKYREGNDHDDT